MSLLIQDNARERMRSRLAEAQRDRRASRVAAIRRAEHRVRRARAHLVRVRRRAL